MYGYYLEGDGEALDIERVLLHYGSDGVFSGGGLWSRCRCPFHDDRTPSASCDVARGIFVCHDCGIKGNSLSVIMKVEQVDFSSAVRKYEEIVGVRIQKQSKSHFSSEPRRFERGSELFPDWFKR